MRKIANFQIVADPSSPKDPSPREETSTAGLAGFIHKRFRSAPTGGISQYEHPDSTGNSASPNLRQLKLAQASGDDSSNSDALFITIGDTPYYLAPPINITSSSINIMSMNSFGSSPPALSIGGNAFIANQASQNLIESQILSPGGPSINAHDTPCSLAPSTTQPSNVAGMLSALSKHNESMLAINRKAYSVDSASRYVIGSQILILGGPTITIKNVPYALPSPQIAISSKCYTMAMDPKDKAQQGVLSMQSAAGSQSTNATQIFTVDGIHLTGDPNTLAV